MATVNFIGTAYSGMDGRNTVEFTEPGYYTVSDSKAAQLVEDFPNEFLTVLDGDADQVAPAAPEPVETPEEVIEPEIVEAPAEEPKKKGK